MRGRITSRCLVEEFRIHANAIASDGVLSCFDGSENSDGLVFFGAEFFQLFAWFFHVFLWCEVVGVNARAWFGEFE